MKKQIALLHLFTILFYIFPPAQTTSIKATNEDCDCVEVPLDFAKLCSYTKDKRVSKLDEYTYDFEEILLKMACVDLKKDSRETIIRRVNCMWNKYKTKCKCDSLGFNVPNGNIAKYVINFNFPEFYYFLKENYNLDFDYTDPADGKNLAKYLDEEIAKTNKYGAGKLSEMQKIRDDLKKTYKYNPTKEIFEIVK